MGSCMHCKDVVYAGSDPCFFDRFVFTRKVHGRIKAQEVLIYEACNGADFDAQ